MSRLGWLAVAGSRALAERRRGEHEGRQYQLERAAAERDRMMDQLRQSLALASERRAKAAERRDQEDFEARRRRLAGAERSAAGYLARYPDLQGLDPDEVIYQGRQRERLAGSKALEEYRSNLPQRPRPPGSRPVTPNTAGNDAAIRRRATELYQENRRQLMATMTGTPRQRAEALRGRDAELRAQALEAAANELAQRGVISPDVATRYRRAAAPTRQGTGAPAPQTRTPEQWVAEVRREHPGWTPEQIADEARRRAAAAAR